jgi:putative chitinase
MSLKLLQAKIGIVSDGVFGARTLKAAKTFFNMSSVRAAHFFAQTGHETGDFNLFSENLDYSAKGLRDVFGKYFQTDAIAEQYQHQPEKIANRVYASRMGNGDESSGDGWKYRGRGAIQLTGKSNYLAFSTNTDRVDVINNPELVAEELAFESAMFFFNTNKLWSICDQGINEASIVSLTKKINGATLGLDDRREKTLKYYSWIENY